MASCPCGVTSSSRVSLARHRKHCPTAKLVGEVAAANAEACAPFESPHAVVLLRHRWLRIVELVEELERVAP